MTADELKQLIIKGFIDQSVLQDLRPVDVISVTVDIVLNILSTAQGATNE